MILVHGGGKEISALLEKLNVESQFADGYRVTDEVTSRPRRWPSPPG